MISFFQSLLIFYVIVSMIISVFIIEAYFNKNINPLDFIIKEIKEIETIGDIFLCLLLSCSLIISIILYYLIKIFYNRFTIAFMNIKIRK